MFLVFASFSNGTKIQKTIWQQTAHIFKDVGSFLPNSWYRQEK
jgi:hypothetical protein